MKPEINSTCRCPPQQSWNEGKKSSMSLQISRFQEWPSNRRSSWVKSRWTDLKGIKQHALTNNFRIDDPLNFEIQVANGQSQKRRATAIFYFDFRDQIFPELSVIMKNLTWRKKAWASWDTTVSSLTLHTTSSFQFSPADNWSQNRCKWNNCQTPKCHLWLSPKNTTKHNKSNHSLCWSTISIENNIWCVTAGYIHWNCNFDDFRLIVCQRLLTKK